MTQPPDQTPDPLAKQTPWGEEPTTFRPADPDFLAKPVSPSGDQPTDPQPPPTSPYAAQGTPPPGPSYQPYPPQPPQPPQPGQPGAPYAAPYAASAPYGAYPPPGVPGYPFGQPHGGANTSMGLGIASLVVSLLGAVCCGFAGAVGVLLGPFAIALAVRARKEMEVSPGLYNNAGSATTGLVTGIIGTVVGLGAIALMVFVFGVFVWGSGSGY